MKIPSTFKLYPTATETDDDKALDLGREFSAKVIKYSPTSDDRWELQITITDGKFSGKSGWISSFLLEDSQGEMLDQFSKAVAYDKIH